MKDKVIQSFNRIALLEDKWDHNQRYSELLLDEVMDGLENAMDIGCGTGEFTKKLARKVKQVSGIDIAPLMVEEAQKRHLENNIMYMVQDFDCMDENIQYDCIVSIATFHHLDLDTALPKVKRMLKPGGVLAVLDLYERRDLIDMLLEIAAIPANLILKRIRNGSRKANREEIEAWNEHSLLDRYMSIKDLKEAYSKHLGEQVRIRRLVFWRYIAVFRKI